MRCSTQGAEGHGDVAQVPPYHLGRVMHLPRQVDVGVEAVRIALAGQLAGEVEPVLGDVDPVCEAGLHPVHAGQRAVVPLGHQPATAVHQDEGDAWRRSVAPRPWMDAVVVRP